MAKTKSGKKKAAPRNLKVSVSKSKGVKGGHKMNYAK